MKVIVPVSGGKDSQVCLSLALQQCDRKDVVCVHQDTGYDHPDTYEQMRNMERFYGVKIEVTVSRYVDMWGFLESAKYFPSSAARGCTERLKQEPFSKWLTDNSFDEHSCEIWFGMRSEESRSRGSKYGHLTNDDYFTLGEVSSFYDKAGRGLGGIICRLPIVEWTTEQVFGHLAQERAPVNPLYSRGHHRVGCYPCLLARKREWELAGKDAIGIKHILKLIELEDRWKVDGNHRKLIRVHQTWDVRKFLDGGTEDLEDAPGECGWCSI